MKMVRQVSLQTHLFFFHFDKSTWVMMRTVASLWTNLQFLASRWCSLRSCLHSSTTKDIDKPGNKETRRTLLLFHLSYWYFYTTFYSFYSFFSLSFLHLSWVILVFLSLSSLSLSYSLSSSHLTLSHTSSLCQSLEKEFSVTKKNKLGMLAGER